MSIFSPNIILSEKEKLELNLGKKISKNEYNNFYSNITSLSKTIGKNPKVFKSFISGLVSETETGKVNSGSAKPVAPTPVSSPSKSPVQLFKRSSSFSSKSTNSSPRASSPVAPTPVSSPSSFSSKSTNSSPRASAPVEPTPVSLPSKSKSKCIYDLRGFLTRKNIINQDATIIRELKNDEYIELLNQDIHDKTYIDDCLKLIGLKLDGLSLNVRRDEMLKLNKCRSSIGKYLQEKNYLDFGYNTKKNVIGLNDYNELTKLFEKNSVDDCLKIFGLEPQPGPVQRQRFQSSPTTTRSKYESQTADMEQKYLKYKNKYLSLKQELGV